MMKRLVGWIVLFAIAAALLAVPAFADGGFVPADGLYTVGVSSSSDMFRVVQCVLHVEDSKIIAVLTLSGHGYGYLYVGTGEEADAAGKSAWVPFAPDADGAYTYAIEIPALDKDLSVAAYSIRYSKWYDRTLNFQSGSLRDYNMVPADGDYEAQVSSDTLVTGNCTLEVSSGAMTARFPLEGYDALRVGEDEVLTDGGVFSLPIPSLDKAIPVQACAAGRETWSDHRLMIRSGTLKRLAVVPDDGVYTVSARSDSNLFPITGCKLTVKDGGMTAMISVGSAKYDSIYLGTARDALKAAEGETIAAVPDGSGCTYTFPVQTLDRAMPVATWSAKKAKWYDRTLTFDAATLGKEVADAAAFSFAFTGGSGRVTISCSGIAKEADQTMATIVFDSSNYTWAEVGGVQYDNANAGGDSTFTLPLTENGATEIKAETTAMGSPHVISYTLYLYTDGTDASVAAGAPQSASEPTAAPQTAMASEAPVIEGLTYESTLKLDYAKCFQVFSYGGGYEVIRVSDGRDYLIVPEGGDAPDGIDPNYVVLKKPLDHVYLAATSAMCLFDRLDALYGIRFSGTRAEGWYVARAAEAMRSGEMRYAGKYSAPDYELLFSESCDLAIESTMILNAPEAREKLEELGIPVWIDISSYEPEPLGRTEWIKAYAALMGCESAAEAAFERQKAYVEALRGLKNTDKTVAYFYVNASGLIVTKPSSDYFARMIELAGGRYVLSDQGDASEASTSLTMDAERFFSAAKDADILIYNASIDDPPASIDDLIGLNAMFEGFKAVREGNVWITAKALYQASDAIGQIVSDLHGILAGDADGLTYLRKMP